MQHQPIILLPPTHEQSVFTYHVEEGLAEQFLMFLKKREITPWRPIDSPEKLGQDGIKVVQIEFESALEPEKLEQLKDAFLHDVRK